MLDDEALEALYRRKLEVWGRAVVDQRQSLFSTLQALGRQAGEMPGGAIAMDSWEADRWFTSAHLLLISIRNVLLFSDLLVKLEPRDEVAQQVRDFDHLVVNARDFRNFLEHFDDYARGEGKRQHTLPTPEDLGGMKLGDHVLSLTYTFGGLDLNLETACTGAILMAQTILKTQFLRPE